MREARRCAGTDVRAKSVSSSESRQRVSEARTGWRDRPRPEMSTKTRIILKNNTLWTVARGLHYLQPLPDHDSESAHETSTIRLHAGRDRDRPRDHRPAARRHPEGPGTDQQREGEEPRQRFPRDPDVHLRVPGQV